VDLVVGLAAVMVVTPPHRALLRAACIVMIMLLLGFGLLVLHPSAGPRLIRLLGRWLGVLPYVIREPGLKIVEQLAVFQTAGWGLHASALGLSLIANTLVGTIIYKLAACAAGIDVPVAMLFWQCTAIFILGKLPISVAEFGVREATLVGTLAVYGIAPALAVVMSMVIFTNRVLLAAIGVGFQLGWLFGRRSTG
jgi:hypothetical protein